MSHRVRFPRPLVFGILVLILAAGFLSVRVSRAQTATDLPLWFDVSSGTPPNIKLNTDATIELQNEEQVAVDPTNPDNLVAVWRDFRLGYRQVGWGYTHDGGTTWTEGGLIGTTPYDRDSDPGIVAGSDGTFYTVLISFQSTSEANGLFVPISFDSGLTWPLYMEGVDTPSGTFEDKEMIACDVTGGPTDGDLYIAWTRFGDTTGIFTVYSGNGISFSTPVPVSDVGSVQWPEPAVLNDGSVVIAWFSYARSAIMCDRSPSLSNGPAFGTDRVVAHTTFFPSTINGGITAFAFPALASDVTGGPYNGRLYCAFSDNAADGLLDLYMTISDDGGATWSPRMRLNDDPLGNNIDQFHPWTSVNADGVVTVAFYDRRLDPANLNFDLWVTHSFDGGQTWTPNQRVTDVSSSPFDAASFGKSRPNYEPVDPRIPLTILSPQGGLIGEYIGLATSRMRATMVFTDTRNGNQDVYAANMPLRLFPPRLTGPDDGITTNNPAVTFTWDDWSIYDSALTYVLEYSSDSTFTTGVTRRTGISAHQWGETMADGAYYWRVRAFDTFGDSSAVVTRRIGVDATAPSAPTPIPPSPLTGDTISDALPTFAWTIVTALEGTTAAATYDLEVASDSLFTLDLRTYPALTTNQMQLPPSDSLTFEQFWYWHVSATDSVGNNSGFSDTQAFFVATPYILGDIDGNGVIDAVDLSLLIDIVFFGGSVTVPPPARAELDCNGPPDAVDLSILIDHVFFGAPAPVCP